MSELPSDPNLPTWRDTETAEENQYSIRMLYGCSQCRQPFHKACSHSAFLLEFLSPLKVKSYYGIDGSMSLLEKALDRQDRLTRGRWKDQAIPCRFDHMDVEKEQLRFDDNSIDSAFSGELIEHLRHRLRVLREIYRVLKPGGLLVLTTPLGNGENKSDIHDHEFTMDELKQLVRECGFKVEGIQVVSQNPTRWWRLIQVFDCRKEALR